MERCVFARECDVVGMCMEGGGRDDEWIEGDV